MISTIIETNDDLTKYVISSFNENNMPINELVLQKVAYQIKMDLGKDHPLYDDLPYYWYCYGPFSETMRSSFNNVIKYLNPVNDDFLIKESYLNDFRSDVGDEYPEIDKSLNKLISQGDYVYSSLTEDIYKCFAPFNMLHTFRYGIFNPTEKPVFEGDGDEYVEIFESCMHDLFFNQYFNDYNIVFAMFQSQLDFLNDEHLIEDKWNILRMPIRSLWFTFAQGLRIKAHDEYYDDDCDQWGIIFSNAVSKLTDEIKSFIHETKVFIDFSKYGELAGSNKEFMGSLWKDYLGED